MVRAKTAPRQAPPDAVFKTSDEFPARIRVLRWLGKHVWLPKGHDALLRAIYDPDSGQRFLFEIDFFGLRYRGDLGRYIDWLVFCYGGAPVSELYLLRDIVRFLRSGRTSPISFYDVGANIGHHSLFMSKLVDHVYAFEPFNELVTLFEDKIKLNGLSNIQILPFALGEEDTQIAYYPGPDSDRRVGSLIRDFPGVRNESVTVDLRNGDRLLAQVGLPKIDILKLDVEGYEPHVLRGLVDRIQSDRPVVLTELSKQSRRGFCDSNDFRRTFYEGALLAEVTGRLGRSYELKTFDYATSEEVLVLPPELSKFLDGRI